jgi:hypothetical protein
MKRTGLLRPEHLRLTANYVKHLIGEGLIVKEVIGPDPCPCFRKGLQDKELYLIAMGPWSIHFSRTGAGPQIVCVALP